MNLIKASNTSSASPMAVILKKDGSFRPDRQLNTVAIPEPLLFLNIRLLLQDIGSGNLVFYTLDLGL